MSPTSYQTALSRDIWRRKRDLNPRGTCIPYRFSRPNPSATWVFLRDNKIKYNWWTRQDSNLWQTGYEPVALTNWATGPKLWWLRRDSNPRPNGYEPFALANWATEPKINSFLIHLKINGGAKRDRTADLLRAKQALSQLSYSPNLTDKKLVPRAGVEPARLYGAWDFKSHVSTYSTTEACLNDII